MSRASASVLVAAGACAGVALLACAGRPRDDVPLPPPASTAPVAGAPAAESLAPGGELVGSSPVPSPSAGRGVALACDAGARHEPGGLRRLTTTQYANTVRDLARLLLRDAAEAEAVVTAAGLDRLPRDRRLDQALDQTHVDETFRVAAALAASLTEPSRLQRVAGACATDADASNDEACFTSFLHTFGTRALRRPIDEDDERFYRAIYGGDPAASPAAYADVITVLLSAPELLYFVEHGETDAPSETGDHALSPHELASRLSYHFWQTLPDDELWQAAADRSLLEPTVLAVQVERLLADPRTRATMAELFGDVLQLDRVPLLDAHVGDPVFAAFAGDDLPGPELRQQAIDEALDLFAHYTWTEPAGVAALFTSQLSFARGDALAALYGVAPWDGSSPPPALPHGTRAGLLSRAWFLASGSADTRPIARGVRVRRQLLCDELAPPPANVNAVLPQARTDMTTRQSIEALTEQPGTACASCHAEAINPIGFAFEGYDALGRARTEQRLFHADGRDAGALPIDTRTVPRITAGDDTPSSGPADLTRLMLQSGKLEACLARHYFRFAFGRREDLAADGCALERLRARLAESGRIRDMLAEVAALPDFATRRFEP